MKEYGFVSFCKENEERIIAAIVSAARCIPPKMNDCDYRFNINNMFCHTLAKEFSLGGEGGTLQPCYNEGYDMLFADRTKISIKIQKEIFQRKMKNGKLTVPKDIVMKNCLGKDNSWKTDLNLDYLMAIQRGKDNGTGTVDIGFAIMSKDKIVSIVEGDQIKIKVYCDKCDFCSTINVTTINNDPNRLSELNRVFSEGLSSTYDSLLQVE